MAIISRLNILLAIASKVFCENIDDPGSDSELTRWIEDDFINHKNDDDIINNLNGQYSTIYSGNSNCNEALGSANVYVFQEDYNYFKYGSIDGSFNYEDSQDNLIDDDYLYYEYRTDDRNKAYESFITKTVEKYLSFPTYVTGENNEVIATSDVIKSADLMSTTEDRTLSSNANEESLSFLVLGDWGKLSN